MTKITSQPKIVGQIIPEGIQIALRDQQTLVAHNSQETVVEDGQIERQGSKTIEREDELPLEMQETDSDDLPHGIAFALIVLGCFLAVFIVALGKFIFYARITAQFLE